MKKTEYLKGQIFNRLSYLCEIETNKDYRVGLWSCVCGKEKYICISNVVKGHTKSCGCLNRELVLKRNYKHGFAKRCNKDKVSRIFYNKWRKMNERCNNKNCKEYKNYGGRGILVEWNSFDEFYNDMYNFYLKSLKKNGYKNTTIERKDVNGNYSKANCVFATCIQQSNNTRRNVFITFRGDTLTLSNMARKYGLSPKRLSIRLNRDKWGIEKALLTPLRKW